MTLVFAAAPPARAQSASTSGIVGTVVDASKAAIAGAQIVVEGPQLIGGPQTMASAEDGTYHFRVLPPGIYQITAAKPGLRTIRRSEIHLPAGATLTIDFELPVADVRDVITVTGRSPMVDVRSAAVPTRLDPSMLHNLPIPRSLHALLNLVPGIGGDVAFGGSQQSNEMLVEGSRTTDPLFQDPATRFNVNWIQEINVVALGAGAEHGGFTGSSGSAVLRSGSNRFSGLGEYWTIRPGWLAENTASLSQQLQKTFNSRELLQWWDTSAQLGGPVAKDRLWFFTGLQRSRHDDRPAGFGGPGSRDERDLQVLAKLTAAVTPALRVEGYIEGGERTVDGEGIAADTSFAFSNATSAPQASWNVRATWTPGAATLFEFRNGGYSARSTDEPRSPHSRLGPPPRFDYGLQVMTQGGWTYTNLEPIVHSTSASVTRYAGGDSARSHEIKAGVEFEATRAVSEYRYPGGRRYWDYFGEPSEVEIWDGEIARATTGRTVLFVHDTWSATDRLTLTPGLRIERNRGSVPQRGGVFATNTVAPRIGAAWDVTSDHRTVARVHYGRYYDTIFASRIAQADRSGSSPYVYGLVVGPGEDDIVELFRNDNDMDSFGIDDGLRHSFVGQWVAGIEHEVAANMSVQAQYIRRRFDTFMGMVDTGTTYEPATRQDPGPDGRLGTPDDGSTLQVFNRTGGTQFLLYTNPPQAFNRYDALQVVARKRYSDNWQLQASYTWSKNRGTVGNRWHVNAARYDLGSPGRFVNPNSFINAFGRATFDPTHEVKLLGTWRAPWWGGFNTSAFYRYSTGQAWGRRANIAGLRQGQQAVRIEPQGTRRLEAINRIDLRAEKTFVLSGPRRTVGVFLDVLNAGNQGVANSDVTNAVTDLAGPRFGEPTAWLDPRMLRAGIRFQF